MSIRHITHDHQQAEAERKYTELSANRDSALRLLEEVRKDTRPNNGYIYIRGQRVSTQEEGNGE